MAIPKWNYERFLTPERGKQYEITQLVPFILIRLSYYCIPNSAMIKNNET